MIIILRVDDRFLSLWERTLDLLENRQQEDLDAITAQIKDANDKLAEASKP